MENAEEIQLILERYSHLQPKEIPDELEEYMGFVAKTGDTVFKWPLIQHLFREKLMNVITDFHDRSPSITDLPHYPNVDPFNFELMKKNLIERMESFNSAPFTIQRICELLTEPRKQYSRIDKFMRAIEKNILVVSTTEPGRTRHESENGESLDSTVNGDLMSEGGNLDVGSSEEEQNVSEHRLAHLDSSNGDAEGEKDEESPADSFDVPIVIDVPLEKLEPEVNVLTIEGGDALLKSEDDTVTPDETEKDPLVDATDDVKDTNVPKEEEIKSEEVTASPSKRLINDGDENPDADENVSKKAKLDEEEEPTQAASEPISVISEANPEKVEAVVEPINSSNEVVPDEIAPIPHEETPETTETATETTEDVIDEVLLPETPLESANTPKIAQVEEEPIETPVDPVETNMEQVPPVATTTEDEDSMKVDTTPLVNAENKMQTDDVEEPTASAMDVDECSGDFIME